MFESAICAHCGEGYQRNLKHRPSRFCGRVCQSAALYTAKHPRETAMCGRCAKPIPASRRRDSKWCSTECGWRTNYELSKATRHITNHGITPEQYTSILEAQDGTCAMLNCGVSVNANGRRLHIDHDHACCPGKNSCGRCIRGLLCDTHNVGLGMFKDDPAALRAAADYLESRRLQAVAS